ncbi:MAG: methyltransferase domain-containing protein [Rhizobiales bacterium TMED168]|nr:MAG: methyltransferase domain-containing protein [Rhizobiales bacterium TMED168]
MDKKNNIDRLLALYNEKNFKEAITKGLYLSEIYPKNSTIFNIIGLSYMSIKEYSKALSVFNELIAEFPNNAEAYINLGIIQRIFGKQDIALKFYNKSLKINPKSYSAYLNKGNILKDMKEYELSEKCYLKAITLKQKSFHAYNNLGTLFEKKNQYNMAIKSYLNAIEIEPSFIDSYRNLIRLYDDLDRHEDAIIFIEKLLTLTPDDKTLSHKLLSLKGEKESPYSTIYAKVLHDTRAENFDNHLKNLNYNAPEKLKDMLKEQFKNIPYFEKAIDLGCGTGLSGEVFKDSVGYLIGVDLSEKMLEIAERKKIYNDLALSEVNNFLDKELRFFDLIISLDVFIYIGNLDELFKNINKISSKDSVFIFCTEDLVYGDFKLNFSGRYSHSLDYIRNLLRKNNFELLSYKKDNLRKEKNKWLKGCFYVASKKSI